MRSVPQISSMYNWLFDVSTPARTRNRLPERNPPSRTPATIAKMWLIGGPQGLSVDEAKAMLGIHPGPQDLVIYTHRKSEGGPVPVPHLISCQPYRH